LDRPLEMLTQVTIILSAEKLSNPVVVRTMTNDARNAMELSRRKFSAY